MNDAQTRAGAVDALDGLRCRSCGMASLQTVLSLGNMPLANSLLSHDEIDAELVYPLDLAFCTGCTLVQITETVSPELVFRDYLYFSSFSDTMLQHSKDLSQRLILERSLSTKNLVIEIASNDGYLLKNYLASGVPVLGVEPALNVARVAQKQGIATLPEFFSLELAQSLANEGKSADIIHAHNVLAHVADLNDVVAGISLLLKPDGIAIVEVPYIKDLIEEVEFDTIYHEHLCYFSLTALTTLFQRHNLKIYSVEHVEIHGGSLRIFAAHGAAIDDSVLSMLAVEKSLGVDTLMYYRGFAATVQKLREDLLTLLAELGSDGSRVAAYGASAKGSTLLNYCGVGRETLEYVVDRSTVKQGRFTPGTRLPIFAPERLLSDQPDYVLLLTWNFADEIMDQQAEYLKRGGHFIIPVPTPRIV